MTGIALFEDHEQGLVNEYGDPNQNIITVSGLTGTGTSTIASFLADQFGMDRIDAGHWFRQQAEQRGMDIHEFDKRTDEIEEREGIDFDLEWDRTALRYAFTEDDFVLEGRLAGVLLADIAPVRVWVTCDPKVVAKRLTEHADAEKSAERLADRDDMTLEEAVAYVNERNSKVKQRYQEKYEVDPTQDRFYNVFVDNSQPLEEVKEELLEKVRNQLPKQHR